MWCCGVVVVNPASYSVLPETETSEGNRLPFREILLLTVSERVPRELFLPGLLKSTLCDHRLNIHQKEIKYTMNSIQ